MPPKRQTQSYLRDLFARRGMAPRHRYGQNFLIDLNIHELIAEAGQVGPGDVILEVGPGAGALTSLMAERGAAVVAVEIDPGMAQLTAEATAGHPGVRVVHGDALANKHTLNPLVLDHLRSGLAVDPARKLKLVANLPYNIATPILSNLLVHPEFRPERLVATIQLELAERIRATPQSSDYGALSVVMQALADVELTRVLPPSVFWPRPKVESAVVTIIPDPAKRDLVGDLPWFHAIVRRIFLHRRKNLRRVLYSIWRDRWTKLEVDTMLDGLGLTGLVRAEAMDVPEWISLANALKARLGEEAVVVDEPESEAEKDDQESPGRA